MQILSLFYALYLAQICKKLCQCLTLSCVYTHNDFSWEPEPLHTAEYVFVLKLFYFSTYDSITYSTSTPAVVLHRYYLACGVKSIQ